MAIAEKTGHSRETVAARIKTGEVNFATSQVVHASTAAKSSINRTTNVASWTMIGSRSNEKVSMPLFVKRATINERSISMYL